MKDVGDLFTIEGDKFDVLIPTAHRAIQKAAPPNPPPPLLEEFRSAWEGSD